MSAKWSAVAVVSDHFNTLRDARTRKYRPFDFFFFYGVPIIVALVCFLLRYKMQGVEAAIGGMAIFTALLFGLLVQVFTLRIRVADSASLRKDIGLGQLIDQLEANLAYTILVSLVLTATLILLAGILGTVDPYPPVVGSGVMGIFLHFFLTVLLVLKRIRSAYAAARY